VATSRSTADWASSGSFHDQLVEVRGLGLVHRLEREVVDDQQLDAGQATHLGLDAVVQPGALQVAEQLVSGGEQHATAAANADVSERGREVCLPDAHRTPGSTVSVLRAPIVRLTTNQPAWSRSDTRMDNWIEEQIRLLAVRGWGIRELTADDRVPDVFSRWVSDIYEHTFLTPESVPEWLTPEDVEREKQKRALPGAFRQVVEAEREALLIRMQIERETLYDAYDRLTSEAELRFSIFPPLALLSATGHLGCLIRKRGRRAPQSQF
jgi:hypothetical protein